MQQFGNLTNFKSMQAFFQKSRLQVRQNLLKRIYQQDSPKKQKIQKQSFINIQSTQTSILSEHPKYNQFMALTSQKLSNQISNTFQSLIQWADFDKNNKIVNQIAKIFGINLNYLQRKTTQEKRMYILQKIHEQVGKNLQLQANNFETRTEGDQTNQGQSFINQSNPQQKNQAFSWLPVNKKYLNLKPIFQQILMQRIKLFDTQLTELTETSKDNFNSINQIMTTARTMNQTPNLLKKLNRNYSSLNNLSQKIAKKNQIKNKLKDQKTGFCNVKIRDHSIFSLQKWTKKQQKQFQLKRTQYKARNGKIQNNPILFQFVKKYTKTIKARQNIYSKWQNRQKQQITSDQLKYLCATSLFLNQTLTSSQKNRYKNNVKIAGKTLISKLQFNIAQHIIQTYKIFMKKVFDLRANYYEKQTQNRKKQYNFNKKIQTKNKIIEQRIQRLKKSIKMYRTIVQSQKMKMLLNPKICRWVILFCQKLKAKIKLKNNGQQQRNKSVNFIKKIQSKKPNSFLIALKKAAPTGKILKRQNHENYRSQTKRYVQSQRFYYQPNLQQAINKFNKIKLNKSLNGASLAFKKQLTGGPLQQHKKIHINLTKKTITMDSKKCLQYITKIQSIWKQHYYRKLYLKIRDQKRKQNQLDFLKKFDRLWRIYPTGKKINFKTIQNRLKRFSMRIKNMAQPYIRTYKKPINVYTSFSKHNYSLNELKLKYSKMSERRLSQLVDLVYKNHYKNIVQNSYVITEKQINAQICKQQTTILCWAVKNSNLELVEKLLEGGGNPNSKNIQNNTCLHQAMKKGDIEIIFILLDYGADLNAKNSKKQTPLYFSNKNMLKLLGLQEGISNNVSQLQIPSNIDNNCLFFKPTVSQIYPQHIY